MPSDPDDFWQEYYRRLNSFEVGFSALLEENIQGQTKWAVHPVRSAMMGWRWRAEEQDMICDECQKVCTMNCVDRALVSDEEFCLARA